MPVFDFPTGTIIPHSSPVIPTNWVSCDGSTYNGNDSRFANLWSVLGTTYGGTGQSAFAVPNLGSRVPVGPRTGTEVSFTNPTFDTNTTGWSTASGSTITRDTSTFDSTPASLRWDKSGTSNALDFGSALQGSLSGTFTAGVTYTASFKIRASSGATATWLEVGLGVISTNNAWVVNGTAFQNINYNNYGSNNGQGASRTGWSNASISWTPTTTVSSGVNFALYDKSSFFGTAGYLWIDSFRITSTEGDGGLGTWSGSTSHLLMVGQSGLKNHRHTITDPTHNHGGNAGGGHSHTYRYGTATFDTKNADATVRQPNGSTGGSQFTDTVSASASFGSGTLNNIAVGQSTQVAPSSAHTNVQPEIALNYIIKL